MQLIVMTKNLNSFKTEAKLTENKVKWKFSRF